MNIKKCFLLFTLAIFCITSGFSQAKDVLKKVVIDAGHGGNDPGAIGPHSKEKDVTLAMALQVGKMIKANCPDVEVYYTRTTDVFVELRDRCKIANSKHADFFISIHCNAAEDKSAHGVETFVMGLHKTASNLAVARKENAAMLLESDYQSKYSGFNPNSPESYVIFSLYSDAYLNHSVSLAAKVQENLVKCTQFTDRKVQQAGFWVLHGVAMPSILVELGFISNPKEEAYLTNKQSQKQMATAICNAFIAYKNQLEGTQNALVEPEPVQADTTQTTSQEPVAQSQQPAAQPEPAVCFKVQVCALPEEASTTDKRFLGRKDVEKFKEGNMWKYTVGKVTSYTEATQLLQTVKVQFPDAFLVAFKNGEKITLSEARKLLE